MTDNLIPFDPQAVSGKPARSAELGERCIEIAGSLSCFADYLEEIAGHIDELDTLLYETKDYGADLDNVVGAAGYLLPEYTERVRRVAEKLRAHSASVTGAPIQTKEGGAE